MLDVRIPLKIISLYSRVNDLLDTIASKQAIPTLSLVPVGEPFPENAAQKLSFTQITTIAAQKLAFFVNTKVLIVLTHWLESERELQALQSLCNRAKARGTITVTILIFPKNSKINFLDNPMRRILWHVSDLIIPIEDTNPLNEVEAVINYLQKVISAHDDPSRAQDQILSLLQAANIGCLGVVMPKSFLSNPNTFKHMLVNLPRIGFVRDTFDMKQVVICVQQDSPEEFSKFKHMHAKIVKLNPIIPFRWYLLPEPRAHENAEKNALILIFKELKGFNTHSLQIQHGNAHEKMETVPSANTVIRKTSKITDPANAVNHGIATNFILPPPSTSRLANRENNPQLVQSLKAFSTILEKDPSREPVKEIEVYVFDEGGITLGHFGKGTIRSCNDPTLITGLFSAIQTFARDVIGGKPRYIETDKLKCVFDVRNFATILPSGKKLKRTITGVALYPAIVANRVVIPHLNYCLDMVQDLLSRGISESECAEVVHQIIESGGLTAAVFPANQERQ